MSSEDRQMHISQQLSREMQKSRIALRECLDCIETLRNDYHMNSDTDELISRSTHGAKAILAASAKDSNAVPQKGLDQGEQR